MSELREQLLSLIKEMALEIGTVVLSSGRTSDYYVDLRRIVLTPRGAYLTARLLLDLVRPEVSAIGGMTLGADPIVSSMIVVGHMEGRDLCGLIVRKKAKRHGKRRFIEGPLMEAGAKVAVVDDVVTTGNSLLRSIERLEEAGYTPIQTLAVLDRMEGGREALSAAGFELESLFTRDDLGIAPRDHSM
ncbi:MAG: orotate phosphoribosyltransferase [Methanothrix sp.]|uniref:Orotate phosphoribosyltransferase n=1 Tax=Methanothrix thermoacetophila (strain DSM 6194 / JCM 14653 / NBRC 101360 / PT) TaxID=349307 RepID=A0B8Q9_METTP|nr:MULTISPECIES: orotate phosphoribosyltransferase [Methanothrix]ABK15083.1 orotate phosphoribosyltransferase [Methanothrix thermoacetophila PT]MBC7079335.1 orotate phosphoribosyltransferase [Methanothrix sp.]NPU86801.1 orotate phosphoribosyltransferase [Methanothrix sp.]